MKIKFLEKRFRAEVRELVNSVLYHHCCCGPLAHSPEGILCYWSNQKNFWRYFDSLIDLIVPIPHRSLVPQAYVDEPTPLELSDEEQWNSSIGLCLTEYLVKDGPEAVRRLAPYLQSPLTRGTVLEAFHGIYSHHRSFQLPPETLDLLRPLVAIAMELTIEEREDLANAIGNVKHPDARTLLCEFRDAVPREYQYFHEIAG